MILFLDFMAHLYKIGSKKVPVCIGRYLLHECITIRYNDNVFIPIGTYLRSRRIRSRVINICRYKLEKSKGGW